MTHQTLSEADTIAELVAKVLYERQYGRVWEDATKWAQRDSLSCARSVIETLRASCIMPLSDLSDAGRKTQS
ncbi:hypothetical protein GCM10007301_18650 [Azorhizobium oxalatiphilum]|uniref:Uncharacterized protein n=1 Tax=Azorhizobium oxalatiphilum TaxID=980631 RepID=A0A917BUI8_9HYPH|nr:hypothetical protein [Azorhizobium oxalatiphilum]GGF59186.1 hypothetical protein GCM10007301_18650 [Azorhizobium oxalatiphilum]